VTGDCLRLENGSCVHGALLTPELSYSKWKRRGVISVRNWIISPATRWNILTTKALLFDPIDVPHLKTSFRDKHVLIVVRVGV